MSARQLNTDLNTACPSACPSPDWIARVGFKCNQDCFSDVLASLKSGFVAVRICPNRGIATFRKGFAVRYAGALRPYLTGATFLALAREGAYVMATVARVTTFQDPREAFIPLREQQTPRETPPPSNVACFLECKDRSVFRLGLANRPKPVPIDPGDPRGG